MNVKHIVQQNQLQWHLWSLHCILGTGLVFSHAGIALDMDAACIQEQGRAGESSQEQRYRSGERMALSSHCTFLRNHVAAKHIENVTANIVPLSKQDSRQTECSLSASQNSCLRLNLNINVATQALLFCLWFGVGWWSEEEECNEICTLQNWGTEWGF